MHLNSSRKSRLLAVGVGVLLSAVMSTAGAASTGSPTKAIQAAIADAGRPQADVQRDANRKPADVLKFAGIKPGDTVAEFLPGQFYYTRILSKLVGPKGHVYVLVRLATRPNPLKDDPRYANVSVVEWKETFALPQPVDVVWTSDNYHDMANNPALNPPGTVQQAFASLKPGGIFLVLDHRAAPGTGIHDTGRLHRIDPEVVKGDALQAGFVLDADSDVLTRPADDHTLSARDPSMHDVTDQFIFKFRKPPSSKNAGNN